MTGIHFPPLWSVLIAQNHFINEFSCVSVTTTFTFRALIRTFRIWTFFILFICHPYHVSSCLRMCCKTPEIPGMTVCANADSRIKKKWSSSFTASDTKSTTVTQPVHIMKLISLLHYPVKTQLCVKLSHEFRVISLSARENIICFKKNPLVQYTNEISVR